MREKSNAAKLFLRDDSIVQMDEILNTMEWCQKERVKVPLQAHIAEITPADAERMLGDSFRSEAQRTTNTDAASRLARAIRRGEFELNGETFKFDWNGKQIDANHRATAIQMAAKPVKSVVIIGLEPKTIKTIDDTRKRGAYQFMHGKHKTVLGAASRNIWIYRATGQINGTDRPLTHELVELIEEYDDLDFLHEVASICSSAAHSGFAPGLLAGVLCVLREAGADKRKVIEYATQLSTGEGLYKGDPALAVRLWVHHRKNSKRGVEVNKDTERAVIVLGWNYFIKGQEAKIIKLPSNREFPKIVTR